MPDELPEDSAGLKLKDLGVMITRPFHQAQNLRQQVESAGGRAMMYPLLEILPAEMTPQLVYELEQLDRYQIIIFVSPNAVEYGLKLINDRGGLKQQRIAAVGKGTAEKFKTMTGREVDIMPEHQFDSDGLLAMPALRQVKDQHILIMRGQSGRELLATTLQQRGAKVNYAAVYQRQCPSLDAKKLNSELQQGKIGIISLTSAEAIENLFKQANREYLVQVPFIVINARLRDLLTEHGVKSEILVSHEASDSGILKMLKQWHGRN